MSEKSSFRSLLEMSDKIAREELGDYYVMGASRMHNMLDCLEDGAKRIQKLTAENEELRADVAQLEQTAINFHEAWGSYRDALHIIAHMGISGLSWQHDYEKCVNIAKEALEPTK